MIWEKNTQGEKGVSKASVQTLVHEHKTWKRSHVTEHKEYASLYLIFFKHYVLLLSPFRSAVFHLSVCETCFIES